MYEAKQQLWDEFEKNGDIYSYLAYCGCTDTAPQRPVTDGAEKERTSLQ